MATKAISKDEMAELAAWLAKKKMKVSNINRYFSDGVALAQLLKPMYPKIIEMHNYSACSSVPLKLKNWETLNFKILEKIKLRQSKEQIDGIVRSAPGYIEKLLIRIMRMEKSQIRLQDEQHQEETWLKNEEIAVLPIQKKVGDLIVTEKEKFILYSIYESVTKEIARKDMQIETEQRKLAHYQNLLRLREERISELKSQLRRQKIDEKKVHT